MLLKESFSFLINFATLFTSVSLENRMKKKKRLWGFCCVFFAKDRETERVEICFVFLYFIYVEHFVDDPFQLVLYLLFIPCYFSCIFCLLSMGLYYLFYNQEKVDRSLKCPMVYFVYIMCNNWNLQQLVENQSCKQQFLWVSLCHLIWLNDAILLQHVEYCMIYPNQAMALLTLLILHHKDVVYWLQYWINKIWKPHMKNQTMINKILYIFLWFEINAIF